MMSRPFKFLANRFRDYCGDESGNPTVEFVMIAPMLFWLTFSVLEIGWINTQKTMLERGLNITVRELRLGLLADTSNENLKARICENSILLRDCLNVIHIEMLPITQDPASFPACFDRAEDIDPVTTYNPGARSEIMFVRVCVVVDPLMPGMGIATQLHRDASGGLQLIAFSAFTNEPS
ncbi:MAG: pilus assembly protein [Rhodobacteraceae bacterium]|nr:pilus assembly protein [Paracoccaceae bacterium]